MGERELGPRPVVVAGKEGGGPEAGHGQGERLPVGVIEVRITVDRHAVAEGQVGTESHTRIMRHADPAIIPGKPPSSSAAAALRAGGAPERPGGLPRVRAGAACRMIPAGAAAPTWPPPSACRAT